MRSRARFNAPKKIICYHVDDKHSASLKKAAEDTEAELIILEEQAAGQTVGFLAGFAGFPESSQPSPVTPDKECYFFSGFDSKTLDMLLDKFDELDCSTDLMCVITSQNQKLPLYQLIDNLWAEHTSMSK